MSQLMFIPVVWFMDQITKKLARQHLSHTKKQYIFGNCASLRLVNNKGAFLGWLKDQPTFLHLFTIVSIGMLLIIGFPYWISGKGKLTGFGLALICAGAIGNYTDRLTKGYVTDFIAFKPNHKVHFNLADFAIFKGAILLSIGQLFK